VSQATQTEIQPSRAVDRRINPAPRLVSSADGYERWAPTYDHAPNPLLAREERYLTPVLTELQFSSVLDLACGTGRWLQKLLRQNSASGVGIDLSAAMLRIAERKREIRGRFAQAACEDLPLAAAAFDLVICSFALGHIRDLGPVACELKRATMPGANVFVSDLHPAAYQHGWRVGFRDREASIQIEVQSHSTYEIVTAFSLNQFECVGELPLWLGEPEQPLFARAGKADAFEDACQLPAVLVCHFRRLESARAEHAQR
jgi:ubiquinone/menaquinone biosynthesis C-methylase UbiE